MSPNEKPRGTTWVIGQLALFAAIGLAPREVPGIPALPEDLRPAALAGGVALGLAGGAVAGLGALQLGSNLTIFPRPKEDGALVQHGLYGVVRHPIYTGILLAMTGLALVRSSTPALVLCLALWGFFEGKARREETWLSEQFPEYPAYQQKVRGRILPRPARSTHPEV